MPLPTIAVPKYPVTIPSTKKTTFFRPFLMKEQKILFMALESKDAAQMLTSMCDIIKQCVDGVDDVQKLSMFDIEYLFIRIRAKSVGEMVEARIKCPSCEKMTDISINLEELEVVFPENTSNKIMLTDKLGVVMRYPRLSDATKNMDEMSADGIIDFIAESIDMVFDGDEVYDKKDFTKDEIVNFVNSLSTAQFENIGSFYRKTPYLSKTVECKCIFCKNDFKTDFRGLKDFFT